MTTRLKFALLTGIGLLIVAYAVFLAMNNADSQYRLNDSAIDYQTSLTLYQQHCGECHGKNLEGESNWQTPNSDGTFRAPPHDETGHTWHHSDAVLFTYTKYGGMGFAEQFGLQNFKSAMPAFEDLLSDDEIVAILNFIKSTWPEDIRNVQAARSN